MRAEIGGVNLLSPPLRRPTGVRTASMMYASAIVISLAANAR